MEMEMEMVGLSVILEAQKGFGEKTPKVINKVSMIKHSPHPPRCSNPPPTSFLDQCFLCKQKLLPEKDIYMYKGDRAFCSEECRCRQILMDEEETLKRRNYSLAAMKPHKTSSSSSSSSFSRNRKGVRNRRAN